MKNYIEKGLDELINKYNLIRDNLLKVNINDVESYLEEYKRDHSISEGLRYGSRDFELFFGIGLFDEDSSLKLCKILKEWQRDKIKICVWGGSAYVLNGGKEETPDLDYILIISKENMKNAKEIKLDYEGFNVRGRPDLEHVFHIDGKRILFKVDDEELKNKEGFHFDHVGFYNLNLNGQVMKIFEGEHAVVYKPTKECVVKTLKTLAEECKTVPWKQDEYKKYKRRLEELSN